MKSGDRDRISENKLNGTPLNADAENTNFPRPHMFRFTRVHYHGHDHYQVHVSVLPQIECPRGLWLARRVGSPANERRKTDDEADHPHQADQHLGPEKAIRIRGVQ